MSIHVTILATSPTQPPVMIANLVSCTEAAEALVAFAPAASRASLLSVDAVADAIYKTAMQAARERSIGFFRLGVNFDRKCTTGRTLWIDVSY